MKKRVIARIFIKDGFVEAFKQQAAVIIPQTRAEDGCLFYSLFQDVSEPGKFMFYEEFKDQAALDIHSRSEHLNAFKAVTRKMHSTEANVEVL